MVRWWDQRCLVVLRFFAELLPCLLVGIGLGRVAPALPARLSALHGLPPLRRQLPGAAPTAISILLLAEASGREVESVAALVFAGTALALVTVPLWWLVLCRLPPV
jgi:predicted permease